MCLNKVCFRCSTPSRLAQPGSLYSAPQETLLRCQDKGPLLGTCLSTEHAPSVSLPKDPHPGGTVSPACVCFVHTHTFSQEPVMAGALAAGGSCPLPFPPLQQALYEWHLLAVRAAARQ